jgi:hypothetical protein
MSRTIWMDRMIEEARTAQVRLPWSRRPASEQETKPLPVHAAE